MPWNSEPNEWHPFGDIAFDQQAIESIEFQPFKRLHDDISVKILTVVTCPDAPHSGAPRSFNSGNGVLHDYVVVLKAVT